MEQLPPTLQDVTNQEGKEDADRLPAKTFNRRRKPPREGKEDSQVSVQPIAAEDPYVIPLDVSPPSQAPAPRRRKQKRAPLASGYNRKPTATALQQDEAKRKAYMASMRAHFADVDAFQLRVESGASASEADSPRSPGPAPERILAPLDSLAVDYNAGPEEPPVTHQAADLLLSPPAEEGTRPQTAAAATTGADVSSSARRRLTDRRSAVNVEHESDDLDAAEPRHSHPYGERPRAEGPNDSSVGTPRHDGPDSQTLPRGSARKAPAYGLSRRSSICFADAATMRRSPGPRRGSAAFKAPAGKKLGGAAEAVPRRSLLSRLSLGLTDAFQRLAMPSAPEAPNRQDTAAELKDADEARSTPPCPAMPDRRSTFAPQGFSPIAESPVTSESLPSTPAAASVVPGTPSPTSLAAAHATAAAESAAATPSAESVAQALGARLAISDSPAAASRERPSGDESAVELSQLQELLRVCGQSTDERAIPSMAALIERHADLTDVRKIGEGTFGEAFRGGGVVFKIVPLEGDARVNGEPQKRAADILGEVAIALALSGLRTPPGGPAQANATSGFVETHGVGVCRGRYADALAAEWRAWDAANGSENDPVDAFPPSQLYVIFVVADGGCDLERFELRNQTEARSIVLQCAMILAVAEEALEFEHRDLHWGNILVRREPLRTASFRLRGVDVEIDTDGLAVTLIDFTLSRLRTASGDVAFCDLEADPELFKGPKGDCQADTYRRMRKATKRDWQRHVPVTNALWLHYLASLLLDQKPCAATSEEKRALRAFRKRASSCQSCSDMIVDEFFQGMWRTCGA